MIAQLIELKPDSTARVEDWAAFINQHREEALATLRAEGVSVESWFEIRLEGKDYLLCYMRAESMNRAAQVAAGLTNPVDAYHQQFKVDTWIRDSGASGKLLIDLSTKDL